MTVKEVYVKAMDGLYLACIVLSGLAIVAITLIIPFGFYALRHE